jgi:uncharacterized protein YidB (DUF937 family)
MDLMKEAAGILSQQFGIELDTTAMQAALGSLTGDGQGQLDLAALVNQMAGNSEFSAQLGSWLGDGGNLPISAEAIQNLFGENGLSQYASRLGIDSQQAAQSLTALLPQLLDQASSGGSLLDEFTGDAAGSLLEAAKSFLK